jgi:hypothetical protein
MVFSRIGPYVVVAKKNLISFVVFLWLSLTLFELVNFLCRVCPFAPTDVKPFKQTSLVIVYLYQI